MDIIRLKIENKNYIKQCASLLTSNFDDFNDIKIAKKIVSDSISDDKISIIAVNDDNKVLGWINGINTYNKDVWEIQPIVIDKEYHRRGIGKTLMNAFEKAVTLRKGITIILGVENKGTSLEGVDIYPNIFTKIKNIENLNDNPYEFYLKLGFTIVGVIPDSNGFGNTDILMAKRVSY